MNFILYRKRVIRRYRLIRRQSTCVTLKGQGDQESDRRHERIYKTVLATWCQQTQDESNDGNRDANEIPNLLDEILIRSNYELGSRSRVSSF